MSIVSDQTIEMIQSYWDSNKKPSFNRRNTSVSDYVWLPLIFTENGRVVIRWQDNWRLEDYE